MTFGAGCNSRPAVWRIPAPPPPPPAHSLPTPATPPSPPPSPVGGRPAPGRVAPRRRVACDAGLLGAGPGRGAGRVPTLGGQRTATRLCRVDAGRELHRFRTGRADRAAAGLRHRAQPVAGAPAGAVSGCTPGAARRDAGTPPGALAALWAAPGGGALRADRLLP